MADQVLMARQPIFDARQNVIAYELLYRSEDGVNPLPLISGEAASSRVILHSYTSITDAGNLRTLPAFINFSQQMLEAETLPSLSPREIVIEILEDCLVTPQLIQAAQRLRDAGFRLALDDFTYDPTFDPLLKIAHIVKLDIRALSASELRQQIEHLRPYKITLLAEKVETLEEYQLCRELGCELFQGFFFSKPELLKGRKASGSKLIISQLLAALSQPETSFDQLNDILSRDPALSYKLLRLSNSAAFGLQRNLSSLQEALVYLGIDELKKWASLIILANDYGKPSELVRQILLTARFCELLAAAYPAVDNGEAFMTGLLLHLDALMNQTQDELLQQIDVSGKIYDALTDRQGELGQLLQQVEAFVHGNWASTDRTLTTKLQRCYLSSLEWCRESMQLMGQL
ncbi:HDOD domain-containing protein [Marinobacterium maritimum]|uniref:HDOD domain-containing protein n=1 Tax=Marinobacterium maritimum TaxID=500162 RepID=A0ABN1I2M1_9GAMM